MRIIIILALLIVALSSSACFSQHRDASVSVKTNTEDNSNVDMYTWDFGQVKAGQKLRHDFILKNDTDKVINITNVRTSCGCTASEIKNKTLKPGESTPVSVQFNSKGYSGNIQQYVYVHTDNIDNSILRFVIKAEVMKE